MPITHAFTSGVANAFSAVVRLPLPEIEKEAIAIDAISVIRSLGRLLTDGDQALVALSHQADLITADVADDPDAILDPDLFNFDLWWVHGLSETDHVQDRLEKPELVAGPQTCVVHNATGATCAFRFDVSWHMVPIANVTRWALLKQLTSYERTV